MERQSTIMEKLMLSKYLHYPKWSFKNIYQNPFTGKKKYNPKNHI